MKLWFDLVSSLELTRAEGYTLLQCNLYFYYCRDICGMFGGLIEVYGVTVLGWELVRI
jgi:hypothetical protein